MLRFRRRITRIQQQETSGAIGVFDHAGAEASLTEQCSLLVAGHAGDRDRTTEPRRVGHGQLATVRDHLGQQRARNIQAGEQIVVPRSGVNVQQQRAARVGEVGNVALAAGEFPHQPRIDGAEGEFAAFGQFARARGVIEQPADFGAGKIGIEQQSGFFAKGGFMSLRPQPLAQRRGAAVLPDDGGGNGDTGAAIPQHGGFALVG